MRNRIDCVKEKHKKLFFCCLSIFTPTANQCVTSIPSSSADRETLSIKHSRSRKMWPFPIAISALHSIYCLWFVGHSTLRPSVSTNFFFPPLSEEDCWCACNFRCTLEVAGEFRPAAPLLCSTYNWCFCSKSLSGCMVIVNEWTWSEQELSASTLTKIILTSLFLFSLPTVKVVKMRRNREQRGRKRGIQN